MTWSPSRHVQQSGPLHMLITLSEPARDQALPSNR